MLIKVGNGYIETGGILGLEEALDYKERAEGTEVVYEKCRITVRGATPDEVFAALNPLPLNEPLAPPADFTEGAQSVAPDYGTNYFAGKGGQK